MTCRGLTAWKPTAIVLRAEGYTMPEIVGMLPVSESTLYRWRRLDEKAGRPWPDRDVLRAALVVVVEEFLEQLRSQVRSESMRSLLAVWKVASPYREHRMRPGKRATEDGPSEPLLTFDAVGEALERSPHTVRRLVADGTLPAVTTGATWGNARPIRWVPLSAVLDYLWGADDDTSEGPATGPLPESEGERE